MRRAYIGIGSNLEDRQSHLEQAVTLLHSSPGIRLLRASSLYETEPVDVEGGWFLNGVVEIETSLSPPALLDVLLRIEEACGRPREREKGTARVLDLDLLLYDDHIGDEPHLQVPHPQMHLRRFVLAPLVELRPDLIHPRLGVSVSELLARLPLVPQVRPVAQDWLPAKALEACVLYDREI